MNYLKFFTVIFLLSFSALSLAENHLGHCARILSDASDESQETQVFISYLTDLVGQNELSAGDLQKFAERMQLGELVSPVPISKLQISSTAKTQDNVFQQIIAAGDLNLEVIKQAVQKILLRLMKEDVSKKETKQKTDVAAIPMQFARVKLMRQLDEQGNENKSPYEVDVMTTLVTQKMWVDLMGKNPAHFKGDRKSFMTVSGEQIYLQPDHPIENVNAYSAMIFANRLSEAHGYKPVYDFTNTKLYPGTNAESGSARSTELYNLKMTYTQLIDADGYRLPFNDEQKQLIVISYEKFNASLVNSGENSIDEYSWFQDNSNFSTQAVASKRPFIIQDKQIYDLLGNVAVFAHPFRNEDRFKLSDIRFVGFAYNDVRENYDAAELMYDSSNRIGFRLVRTVKRK